MITKKIVTHDGGVVTQKICKKSGGKISYTKNRVKAERLRLYNIFNRRMREYFCIYCNYYHLTTTIGVKHDIPDEYLGLRKQDLLSRHTKRKRERREREEE